VALLVAEAEVVGRERVEEIQVEEGAVGSATMERAVTMELVAMVEATAVERKVAVQVMETPAESLRIASVGLELGRLS
jgi:hypothetical protein